MKILKGFGILMSGILIGLGTMATVGILFGVSVGNESWNWWFLLIIVPTILWWSYFIGNNLE